MEEIDFICIDKIKSDKTTKSDECKKCNESLVQLFYSVHNLWKYIRNSFKNYELALWIKSNHIYIKRKDRKAEFYKTKYNPREIVYAELGSNIDGELSYEHPCIVIRNEYDKLFVVPCSSSKIKRVYDKEGKLYPEYLIVPSGMGFIKETVVMLRNAKWISKSRIIRKSEFILNKDIYKDIYNKLFSQMFAFKFYENIKMQEKIDKLEEQIEELLKENNALKKHIS